MTDSATYSLWFEPTGDIAYKLQERIKKLSKKHQTPVFPPHVTLLGSINTSETVAVSLTNTLASPMSPFDLELTKAGYQNTFYQSLFVHVAKTAELEEVRKRACRLFELDEVEYMPHLSLLYGDLSQKEKQLILNLIGREFYIQFTVKSIVLMKTDDKVDQWKRVHTAVFKH
jgi:2'-5' RNA ligase